MARETPIPLVLRAQFAEARRRGALARRTEPHGRAVRFLRSTRQLVIDLVNGTQLRLPIARVPGTAGLTEAEVRDVTLSPGGMLVVWPRVDLDLTVHALAILALGEKTVMRASAAVAGSTKSPAKAAASRLNGQKGGRPRKTATS